MRRSILFSSVAALLMSAACMGEADPAGEAPVDLAPGLYAISTAGKSPFGASKPELQNTICVRSHESDDFPYRLAESMAGADGWCAPARAPREGNAISGELSCRADPKMATGANRFVYSGVIGRDSVRVEMQLNLEADLREDTLTKEQQAQLKMAGAALKRMRFVMEAKRTGDCG